METPRTRLIIIEVVIRIPYVLHRGALVTLRQLRLALKGIH